MVETLRQDLRYSLRALRRQPQFSIVVLCLVAFGSGATTLMFSVINGVLLTPLPYPQPDRLVTVTEQTEKTTQFGNLAGFSYPDFLNAEHDSRTVALAAWRPGGGTISSPGEAAYVNAALVSASVFSVLGT